MPYNLPPPWDPGYALPDNVVDEGLERRALVTKQMPRGTYDDPSVGTGGYAVPGYVLDEGYGQGTYTTKWQPSGTYNGGRVPHWLNRRPRVVQSRALPGGGRAVTVQPLGDDAMPEPYESYGRRAAAVLMSRVAGLPRGQQGKALKVILDKVDKSAWSRTQTIWNRYRAQGMDPVSAFPAALSRALSTGLAAEVIMAGQRSAAPQANSLLGLGCYGSRAALGADWMSQITAGPVRSGGSGNRGTAVDPNKLPPPGTCYTSPGYSWVNATPDMPGHWERTRVGQSDVPRCPDGPPAEGTQPNIVTLTPEVRDKRTIGVQVSPTPDFAYPFNIRGDIPTGTVRDFRALPDILIFPPMTPDDIVTRFASVAKNTHVMGELPQPWADWIKKDLTEPASYKDSTPLPYNPTDFGGNESDLFWFQRLGIAPGTTLYGQSHGLPAATITWPIDNATLGIYYTIEPMDFLQPRGPKNPTVIKIRVSKIPEQSWEYSIIQFFTRIYDAVKSALDDLGDLACSIFGGPAGPAAGAAASTAVGAGPAVGVAGAQVAKSACGMPPPPMVPTTSSVLPVAILAGGAALAVVLLTRKKKHP